MISYKLAKQLKDAGFQQEFGWGGWICKHGAENDPNRKEFCDCSGDALIKLPTLSELIESCGDEFYELTHVNPKTEDEHWEADNFKYHNKHQCGYGGLGKSPEEAVAKLWLKLNAQKT